MVILHLPRSCPFPRTRPLRGFPGLCINSILKSQLLPGHHHIIIIIVESNLYKIWNVIGTSCLVYLSLEHFFFILVWKLFFDWTFFFAEHFFFLCMKCSFLCLKGWTGGLTICFYLMINYLCWRFYFVFIFLFQFPLSAYFVFVQLVQQLNLSTNVAGQNL